MSGVKPPFSSDNGNSICNNSTKEGNESRETDEDGEGGFEEYELWLTPLASHGDLEEMSENRDEFWREIWIFLEESKAVWKNSPAEDEPLPIPVILTGEKRVLEPIRKRVSSKACKVHEQEFRPV